MKTILKKYLLQQGIRGLLVCRHVGVTHKKLQNNIHFIIPVSANIYLFRYLLY